jgi:hypothetical protein
MLRFLLAVLCAASLAAQTTPPDAQIEAQIRERLAKSVIGKDGFKVTVKGGVAYWEGSTAVAQHKGAATRMAKSAGARRVVNNIRVTGARAPGAPTVPRATPPPGGPAKPAPSPAKPTAEAEPMRRIQVRWIAVRR